VDLVIEDATVPFSVTIGGQSYVYRSGTWIRVC